jgi:phenylacetic acid degradation operon negative regulatory protein
VSSLSTFFDALEDEDVPQPWTTPGPVAQRPPRLLLTLLGDYWWQRTESLPSAAIVGLLAEFGVSDSAARAALSRLTRNGLLVTSRGGRRTFVRLSARAADVLDDGARRIFSFGSTPAPWDGMWSLVAFSIPEQNRSARDELRKALRWLGFAPLYDGLWVSPRDHASDVISRLKDLGITTATAFRATALPVPVAVPAQVALAAEGSVNGASAGLANVAPANVPAVTVPADPVLGSPVLGSPVLGGPVLGSPVLASPVLASTGTVADIPGRAWDLTGLHDRYQEFVEYAGLLRDQVLAGEITAADALVARTRVMNEWRAFPAMDPDLPDELLPPAWPRARARELFIACYDLLGPLAARRVRQIIARYSPDLAVRAAYHSTELTLSAAED